MHVPVLPTHTISNTATMSSLGRRFRTDEGTKAIQAASAVEGVKEVKSELTVASK